jgi:hypothetical protein
MICWIGNVVRAARAAAGVVHEQIDRRAVHQLQPNSLPPRVRRTSRHGASIASKSSSSARKKGWNSVCAVRLGEELFDFEAARSRFCLRASLLFARLHHPVEPFELILARLDCHAHKLDVREGAQSGGS